MHFPNAFDIRTTLRHFISKASVVLPRARGISIERKFRGYEDAKKLQRCDGVVISYGKSGRTWLRALLWRYFTRKHGHASDTITAFDEFHITNLAIPVLDRKSVV